MLCKYALSGKGSELRNGSVCQGRRVGVRYRSSGTDHQRLSLTTLQALRTPSILVN